MILSFEEIKNITVGALYFEQKDEGIQFYKYRPALESVWEANSSALGLRAMCPSGVRLDFHTNSKHMTLEVGGKGNFEIYINDLLRYIVTPDSPRISINIDTPFEEPLDDARITVYLPAHVIDTLKRVELDDNSYVRPHKYDRKILFMGDSITQGWESGFDSLSYANRVSRHFNADSVVQGVGGACFYDNCLEPISFDPDWVIVSYGTNDFRKYKNIDEFRPMIRTFMPKLMELYGDKKIFVVTPIWRENQTPKFNLSFSETREEIISQIEKYGLIHIDGATLVPPMTCFFTDGLHPNSDGFSIYAENFIKAIRREMELP